MAITEKREKRRLDRAAFESAALNLRMTSELKLAAYQYMVQGKTFGEVAKTTTLNDRSIQRKVRLIWQEHLRLINGLPEGWVRESVSLPEEEMKSIQQRSKELLKGINSPER